MTGHYPDSPEVRGSGGRGTALRAAGLILPAMILAGAGGFALQRTMLPSHDRATARSTVNAYSCPGGPVVSELRSGDRVFVVGVSGAHDGWLLIRNPERSGERWWVRGSDVTTDASVAGLPTMNCAPPATVAPAAPAPATASATASATTSPTTSPTASPATTAAIPSPAAASPATSAPAPTTGPVTATPSATKLASSPKPKPTPTPTPVVGTISVSSAQIWEYDITYSTGTTSCNASTQEPTTSTISASVRNATQVTLSWSGPASGSKQMSDHGGGTWSAVLGPFDQSTVPGGSSSPLSITVTAQGPAGTSSATTKVMLHDCSFG